MIEVDSEEGEEVDEEEDAGLTEMSKSDHDEGEEGPLKEARRADQRRRAWFVREAWGTFKSGVLSGNLNNFRRLLESEDCWLSEGSTNNLLNIGEAVMDIVCFIRQR